MNAVSTRLISPAKMYFYRSARVPQLHWMPFTHLKDLNTRAWQPEESTIIIISTTAPANHPISYPETELIAAQETLITALARLASCEMKSQLFFIRLWRIPARASKVA